MIHQSRIGHCPKAETQPPCGCESAAESMFAMMLGVLMVRWGRGSLANLEPNQGSRRKWVQLPKDEAKLSGAMVGAGVLGGHLLVGKINMEMRVVILSGSDNLSYNFSFFTKPESWLEFSL